MFYFRINRIKIFDNHVNRVIDRRDKADVEILSFVNTESSLLPQLKGFTNAKTEAAQKAILAKAVTAAVEARVLTPIENVKDYHELIFGDTGYVLYQADTIPNSLHWQMLVLGSKARMRDRAKLAQEIVSSNEFGSFATNVLVVASASANPIAYAAMEIGKFITNTIIKLYANKRDDMLGLVYQSWNRQEHYKHGERKKDDQADLTGNIIYDYSIFGFDKQ